jgi:hypothetical protein
LGTGNHFAPQLREIIEKDELRDLRCLSRTRLTDEDENLVLLVKLQELTSAEPHVSLRLGT